MPTSLQVLMLEDNPSDAELYLLELRRAGFDPEWKRVETEEEFLAALHPALDIILSDFSLPQFDGLSALRLLRARSLDLPFILISGMIGEDIAISAMKEGADDYLLKDRLARLGPAVKNALEQKRIRDERKQREEALRKSEEQYRILFEKMDEGYCVIEMLYAPDGKALDYRFVEINPAFEKHTGLREALGKTMRQMVPDQDESWFEIYGNVARTGEAVRFENPSLPMQRYYDVFAFRIGGDGSQKVGILFSDITERKRTDEALKASENKFSNAFRTSPIALTITRIQDSKFVDVNESACKLFGYSRAELIGHTSLELGIIDAKAHAEIRRNLVEQGSVRNLELRGRSKSGRSLILLTSIENLEIAGEACTIATMLDITEPKRAEQQMLTLVESMPDGVLVVNAEGQIEVANAQIKALFGYQQEELLGQSIETLLPERVRNIHPGHRAGYLVSPRIRTMGSGLELYARRKDGTEFPVDISLSPVETGHGTATVAIVRDITERKRAEEERLARETAERANQAKSEFLSRMSHELRTPMNSILGFAQLLKMDELAPDQLSSLEQILKSGSHLLDLINEVLEIARIESGRIPISPEPVHLDEALQSAVELIQPLADQRGISIQIKIPSSRDIFVTADRQRLKQVLLNLLSNAVKYNREGGQIHITASLLVDGFMHLTVRDTGEGIPPEKMERLFIPFERLELNPDLLEGTGLGLAVSKGLVEAMGGRIGAQSTVGVGSTFWFDLELTTQQKEAIVMAEVDDYLESAQRTKKGLVLYVEDNLSNIQLIEKILARLPNVELICAMQGRLALDLARQHKPGLILLDLHLPDIHGSEVLQQLRAEVETKDIPIVVMSAIASHGQIERTLTAGANAYLTKPIDVKEFLKVVGEMLER